MADKKFIDGIRLFTPSPTAPDWVIANGTIKREDLKLWLLNNKGNDAGEIRFNIKKSQKGGLYIDVDTYEPKAKPLADVGQQFNDSQDDILSDLPF